MAPREGLLAGVSPVGEPCAPTPHSGPLQVCGVGLGVQEIGQGGCLPHPHWRRRGGQSEAEAWPVVGGVLAGRRWWGSEGTLSPPGVFAHLAAPGFQPLALLSPNPGPSRG